MKGIVYRSAALALALVVVCSALALPVSATDYQSTYNFWNWAYDNSWFLGKAIIGFSAGNVCQVSEDGLHHATTHSGGGGSVDGQRVYNCMCDLCGQDFQAVATDLQQTYNQELPNNGYTSVDSDGNYSGVSEWSYSLSDQNQSIERFNGWYSDTYKCDDYFRTQWNVKQQYTVVWRYYFTPSVDTVVTIGASGHAWYSILDGTVNYYTSPSSKLYSYDGITETKVASKVDSNPYSFSCIAGVNYFVEWAISFGAFDVGSVTYQLFSHPSISFNSLNPPVSQFNRPSTFAPSFTYEDGDGWQVHLGLDGNQLIDETNLTYYNPVTNTTTNIQNWTYDYSDRSYTVLTDSNNTTTITYGDEYITINEGDNITYNIYYYTAPDSSGDGDSSGSDGSGDDDGGGLLDKIGELIGSVLGGFIDVIGAALGKVIDSLIDLVTLTIDKLVNVINLFGSFGDALGVLWSWLPEEVVTVLVSGVTVIVFASVIKLFMR